MDLAQASKKGSCNLKVSRVFNPDIQRIHTITPCSHNSVWINDFYNNVGKRVKLIENSIHDMGNADLQGCDVAITASGTVLLSQIQPKLKAMHQQGGEIHPSQYDISPLNSFGLHVTMDQKVIVGGMQAGISIAEPGKRAVIVMDQEGRHLAEYDQELFTNPFRITSTTNGNIFVVDMLVEPLGKVVVLDRKGNVLTIYNGHPDHFFQDKPFEPKGIIATPADNVIVCDASNNVIHVLNFEGQNIAFFKTDELGIFRPFSLAMSTPGHFYIGCTTKDSSPETAKLYEMEYAGF